VTPTPDNPPFNPGFGDPGPGGVPDGGRGGDGAGEPYNPDSKRDNPDAEAGPDGIGPLPKEVNNLVPVAPPAVIGAGGPVDLQETFPAISVREFVAPSVTFRPQLMSEGDVDLRFDHNPPKKAKSTALVDSPITVRMEGWGAQGGEPGGPYLSNGGEWAYTQKPDRSRYLGGTAAGGILITPSEVDMQNVDDDFAPGGLTTSEVYFAAGPGASVGWGTPELAGGGLKDGISTSLESDDLVFYSHDSVGDKTEVARCVDDVGFQPHGELRFADSTATISVDTTPIIIPTWDEAGPTNGCTVNATAGTITVGTAGKYLAMVQISFEGSNATVYECHLRVNGAEQSAGFHRYLGTGTDRGSASFQTLLDLSANDVISVYVEADKSADFEPIDAQFTVVGVVAT
jgi:hypothetical protein